jgi:CMP-N,N'-diacetyllegionaminic acid synthase
MIDGKRVLAIIPARGGSKGVARKNIRTVAGKPLIAWTIAVAQKSKYIDRLILSSEDAEIIQVAKDLGCEAPFVRPAALAQDETPGIDPVLHALEQLPGFDLVVLLQATSPLRNTQDIDACLEHCLKNKANVCVTLTQAEPSPYLMYTVTAEHRLQPVLPSAGSFARRQDLPPVSVLNGAIYVADCSWLKVNKKFITPETLGYLMPRQRSLDIDTETDLLLAGLILEQTKETK